MLTGNQAPNSPKQTEIGHDRLTTKKMRATKMPNPRQEATDKACPGNFFDSGGGQQVPAHVPAAPQLPAQAVVPAAPAQAATGTAHKPATAGRP